MRNPSHGLNPEPDGASQPPAGGTISIRRVLDDPRRDHPRFFASPPRARQSPRPRHHSYPICPRWRRSLALFGFDWATFPPAAKRVVRRVWRHLRHRHARYRPACFERFLGRFQIRFVE